MKRFYCCVLTIATVVLLSASCATAATTLMKIGRSPFYQPPLTSVDDLRSMVSSEEQDVRKGFELAGYSDLADAFIAQMPTTEIEKVQFHKGDSFAWMLFKKKGKGQTRVTRDVTWGADEPFWGFNFHIDQDNMRYSFCVPLGCGNIALIGAVPVPAEPAPAPAPAPAPEPAPVVEAPPAAPFNPYNLVLDVGYAAQFDPGSYLFARVGGEYRFNSDFSVLGLVGGAPQIGGDDGKSAFTADVIGEYRRNGSPYFVNFGVGAWITDGDDDLEAENSQVDLIAAFGGLIYGEQDSFNTSLFIEIRSAADEIDSLREYGRFGVGLRFRF